LVNRWLKLQMPSLSDAAMLSVLLDAMCDKKALVDLDLILAVCCHCHHKLMFHMPHANSSSFGAHLAQPD